MKRIGRDQHIEALVRFTNALSELLGVSDFGHSYGSDPAVYPKQGREAVWRQHKGEVDRAAPAAGAAFSAAGVYVDWKPPGTLDRYPLNPATGWATVLEAHPRFTLDVLEAVCNQALGSLESGVNEDSGRRRLPTSTGSPASTIIVTLVTAIVAGLVVAGLAYYFGWAS